MAVSVTHLAVAADPHEEHGALMVAALRQIAADPADERLDRVTLIDMSKGPAINRFRSALGLAWHARERLQGIREKTGRPVDAVLEVGGGPFRHLMGLGRTGVPAARWQFLSPAHPEDLWAERHVGEEGVHVFCAHADMLPSFADVDASWLPPACPDAVLDRPPETRREGALLIAPERKPAELDGLVRRVPKDRAGLRHEALGKARLLVHLDRSRLVTSQLMTAIGSGVPVYTTPVGDGFETLFEANRHVLWGEADDARPAVERFLSTPWIGRVGEAGRARVAAAHRYVHRADTVVRHLLP